MIKKVLNILISVIVFIGGVFLIFSGISQYTGMQKTHHTLYRFCDSLSDGQCGYLNEEGDTIIPPGTYGLCLTDSFQTFGVVLDEETGFWAIDTEGNVLYEIFCFDNGPDYYSEGRFRIILDGKIGYADSTGRIVIEPRFEAAFPFENGKAKVAIQCETLTVGEFSRWVSDQWFYIGKDGKTVEAPFESKNHQ
ncbi:MAG TPA: WG repeat-containing protein [Prolixibacteraceae bacterium]|nr:WG repeat-containing protein [Prolixibacteraceae bacterium]